MKRKGQIWISAVIYILIITTSLLIVLKFGIPLIDEMKDRNSFEKSKNMMKALDEQIIQVANEGEGSQRVVTLDISEGKLLVENDQVVWEFETDNDILDERTSQETGNIKIVSNANVQSIENEENYILSTVIDYDSNGNPIGFGADIKKIGDENNWDTINASLLIQNITYDGVDSNGTFKMFLGDDESTSYGNGYTKLVPEGNNTNLGSSTIIAHINTTLSGSKLEYDIHITLNSYSDFLVIETKNIEIE
ncbi:hypothetical protein C0585_06125 [Candidatus Woesearchaeota archaeon]|nr:MAG: hypothetical protein C0585_06125 [Candidatus Woesearchaeota archaeon]